MPFSSSRYSWLKIAVCLLGLVQLTGCSGFGGLTPAGESKEAAAVADLFEEAAVTQPEEKPVSEKEAVLESVVEEVPQSEAEQMQPIPIVETPLTVYDWGVIQGGFTGNSFAGIVESAFVRPVAVAARNEYVYVVDQGLDQVLRYDRASQRLSVLLDLKSAVKGEVADIYVDKDFSFYITDTDGGRVLHYSRDGSLIRVFSDYFNLTKPVSVVLLRNGDLAVADGHYDHILRFNPFGKLIAAHGGRGAEVAQFTNIMAMAVGPDGYYVGARVGRKVQVMSLDGHYNYSFEEGKVIFPAAIVVDEYNRSYVADYMDHQIKVFDRGRLIATIGRSGSGPGQFMRVTDMWLDEDYLYIVDSLNARIQVARLAPLGSKELEFNAVMP